MSEIRLQHSKRSFSYFTALATGLLAIVFLQAVGVTFLRLGVPLWLVLLIVPGSLLGSMVNIPITTIKSDPTPCIDAEHLQVWGVSYAIHEPECPGETRIFINVGGALIPVFVSVYLLAVNPLSVIPSIIAAVIVTGFVHRIARIEPNVGIVTPGILPAIVSAFAAIGVMILFPMMVNTYVIAYVAGTLGTLIGADLLNLNKLGSLRTGKASIGGAGTWDGVFLTGIFAAFFV